MEYRIKIQSLASGNNLILIVPLDEFLNQEIQSKLLGLKVSYEDGKENGVEFHGMIVTL